MPPTSAEPKNIRLSGPEFEPEGPEWKSAESAERLAYWTQLGTIALAVKRDQVQRGIGANGRTLLPAKVRQGKYRGAKGPALVPFVVQSRTYRLLADHADPNGATIFWRSDGPKSWAKILAYHAYKHGPRSLPVRNTIGISAAGRKKIVRDARAWWDARQAAAKARLAAKSKPPAKGPKIKFLAPGERPAVSSKKILVYEAGTPFQPPAPPKPKPKPKPAPPAPPPPPSPAPAPKPKPKEKAKPKVKTRKPLPKPVTDAEVRTYMAAHGKDFSDDAARIIARAELTLIRAGIQPPPTPTAKPVPPPAPRPAAAIAATNPAPAEFTAHTARVESLQRPTLERLAARHGLSVEEYTAKAEAVLRSVVDASEVRMRHPARLVAAIANSGRFKSQFETGTSEGLLDLPHRAKVEAKSLGVPTTAPARERPVYGFLAAKGSPTTDAASAGPRGYGEATFHFKPGVIARARLTIGDSLDAANTSQSSPTGDPSVRSIGWLGSRPLDLVEAAKTRTPTELVNHLATEYNYVEAQLMGGVDLADVTHVVFDRYVTPEPAAIAALAKRGIPWTVQP